MQRMLKNLIGNLSRWRRETKYYALKYLKMAQQIERENKKFANQKEEKIQAISGG